MGYCGACGKKSIRDELYCNKCGGKIKEKKARTGWTQRMSNIIFAIFLLFSLFIGLPVLILSGGKIISKTLAGYPLWEKSEEQIMKECLQQ
ncbi:MAG: hypothetical protein GX221_08865 [Candidatus Riflebacteria bacterium]|nr:hypothetical protein [Candidatus Riflebacteria bacterium]